MGRLRLVAWQHGWVQFAGCESFPVWIPGGGGGRLEGERLFWLVGPRPGRGQFGALLPQLLGQLPVVGGAQRGDQRLLGCGLGRVGTICAGGPPLGGVAVGPFVLLGR